MEFDPQALVEELRSLRKGRGTRHPSLDARLGPQLRSLCEIEEGGVSAAVIRSKLTRTIKRLLRDQPEEFRTALLAALALHSRAVHRTLTARQIWLAHELHYHERTARRRVDEAIDMFMQAAGDYWHGSIDADGGPEAGEDNDAWRVRTLDALLRLDTDCPEVTERRGIVVVAEAIEEITCRVSVPQQGPNHGLDAEAVFGGRLWPLERPTHDHFVFRLELPRLLRRGEHHDFGLKFTIPPGQSMAPHYVLQPLSPYEAFDLTVCFDTARLPKLIWRLDGVAPRVVDSPWPRGQQLRADRFGQLRVSFRELRQGRAYGISWMME